MGSASDRTAFGRRMFSGLHEYRYGLRRPVTLAGSVQSKAILSQRQRREMANNLADRIGEFFLTPFENEAPARHGLRSAFALQGHSWREADAEANKVVQSALRIIGAERPTYKQGQPDYTCDSDYCSWCHSPIEQDGWSKRQRFCCVDCARSAMQHRDWKSSAYAGEVLRSAKRLVTRAKAPLRQCHHCRKGYRSESVDSRFCSPVCSSHHLLGDRLLEKRDCDECGKTFQPSERVQRFCSYTCKGIGSRRERLETYATVNRQCQCCGSEFTPTGPQAIYCSKRCGRVMTNRAYLKRKRDGVADTSHICTCQVCQSEFKGVRRWSKFCSEECKREARKMEARERRRIS